MSAASVVAELTKIDALPGAKVKPSIGDGNVDAHTGNDALGMCGHVITSLKCMLVVGCILWNKSVINAFEILTHRWIPILTNAQRTTRMLHKEVEQSRIRQLWKMSEYLIGYQMEAAGLRL